LLYWHSQVEHVELSIGKSPLTFRDAGNEVIQIEKSPWVFRDAQREISDCANSDGSGVPVLCLVVGSEENFSWSTGITAGDDSNERSPFGLILIPATNPLDMAKLDSQSFEDNYAFDWEPTQ
jgi:hypothetical protein